MKILKKNLPPFLKKAYQIGGSTNYKLPNAITHHVFENKKIKKKYLNVKGYRHAYVNVSDVVVIVILTHFHISILYLLFIIQ